MKKKLFTFLSISALFLTSCSDDNNSESNNSTLVSTWEVKYVQGEQSDTYITNYENDQIINFHTVSPQNIESDFAESFYNNKGLLTSTSYSFGVNGTDQFSINYTYNDEGRLTKIENSSGFLVTYTYNNDNTITSHNDNVSTPTTFYINSNNYIYKQINAEGINEVTYDGGSPTLITYNGDVSAIYEYDTTHDMSLLNIDYGTGNFKSNQILRSNGLWFGLIEFADKYVTKITYPLTGVVYNYEYVFNSQGLPTKKSTYINDELASEKEYFYN